MTTTAARLLRQARRGRQFTQRQLAVAASARQPTIADVETGTHSPGVDRLDQLLGAAGYRLLVLPTRAQSAADAGDLIHECLRHDHDESTAFRHLIALSDDLSSEHGALRVALTACPPALVGDSRFDAAIAAIVEHHLVAERLSLPGWVAEPSRRLEDPWTVDPFAGADIAEVTPIAFRRHGVLLDAAELVSV